MKGINFGVSQQASLFGNRGDSGQIQVRNTRRRGRPAVPIAGKRFTRLVVIGPTRKGRDSHIFWICQCDCGRRVVVGGDQLRRGGTRSCGCLKRELAAAWMRKLRRTRLYGDAEAEMPG